MSGCPFCGAVRGFTHLAAAASIALAASGGAACGPAAGSPARSNAPAELRPMATEPGGDSTASANVDPRAPSAEDRDAAAPTLEPDQRTVPPALVDAGTGRIVRQPRPRISEPDPYAPQPEYGIDYKR
jgi:hypothetical protein